MTLARLHLDKPLFYALLMLATLSLVILYSASARDGGITLSHFVRLTLGFAVLIGIAQVRPEILERWGPYVFGVGLLMLLAVLGIGAQVLPDVGLINAPPVV